MRNGRTIQELTVKNSIKTRMLALGLASAAAGVVPSATVAQQVPAGYGYAGPAYGQSYDDTAQAFYGWQPYAQSPAAYDYGQGGYYPRGQSQSPSFHGYARSPYDYAQPGYGYGLPAYGYGQQGYGYAQQPPTAGGYGAYYGYGQSQAYSYSPYPVNPYRGNTSGSSPFGNGLGNVPWSKWNGPDIFGENSPFEDPLQNEGYWTKPGFRPWHSGPFAPEKWKDHPATQFPWGNFPGWGDGFWGGFGPDTWEGATPWGNDVPFKWVDPTDPEESIAEMWEDALNTPNKMGRMPPGFTAPYISVPNPIDVENEFERNAQNAPDEIHKMWGPGGGSTGSSSGNSGKSGDGKGAAGEGKAGEKKDQDGKGKQSSGKEQAGDGGWGWKDDWWNEDRRRPSSDR